jgi:uncharacterized protein (DUF1501 family)
MINNFKEQLASLNRRGFIRAAGGCSALTSTAVMSSMLNLKATHAAMSMQNSYDGYKAMVCIFLFGGNDSFNMLVPREDEEYDNYAAIRGNPADGGLALNKEDLLPISDASGRRFGIHPSMPEIKELYDDKACAFVANIGSLIRPTTMSEYQAGLNRPLGLFSHADLIRHWQTSIPESRSQVTGWAGRMADLVTDETNANPHMSMNFSISGTNIFQTGRDVIPYVVGTGGATTLSGYNSTNAQDRIYTRATDGMLGQTYADLLEKTHARSRRTAVDAAIEFNTSVNSVQLQTEFPESYLGAQLKMIARTIGARELLQQRRQIFFVTVGGWDHHDEVLANQERMFPDVSQSIKAFYDATVELNTERDVVAFTASDFGRTLSSNGRGSDHAWGGNQLAVGGTVNGGDVKGTFPDRLFSNDELDTGRGRLIPTTSTDEYAFDIANWFGIPNDSNMEAVLPNVRNFISAGADSNLQLFADRKVDSPGGFEPPPGGYPPPPPGKPDAPSVPPGGGGSGGFGGGDPGGGGPGGFG